jgi:hypothetical protein
MCFFCAYFCDLINLQLLTAMQKYQRQKKMATRILNMGARTFVVKERKQEFRKKYWA